MKTITYAEAEAAIRHAAGDPDAEIAGHCVEIEERDCVTALVREETDVRRGEPRDGQVVEREFWLYRDACGVVAVRTQRPPARPAWVEAMAARGACEEACAWASDYVSIFSAWRACERGDWMHWLVSRWAEEGLVCEVTLERVANARYVGASVARGIFGVRAAEEGATGKGGALGIQHVLGAYRARQLFDEWIAGKSQEVRS